METSAGDRTVGSATRFLPQIRWVVQGLANVASEAIVIVPAAGTTTLVDIETAGLGARLGIRTQLDTQMF
jgi:hypothetical protein